MLKAVISYYTVLDQDSVGGQTRKLVRFRLPRMSREKRRKVIEHAMAENDADALIECFWTKGSIVRKNQQEFDAVLVIGSGS
jgi:hypothetical protein